MRRLRDRNEKPRIELTATNLKLFGCAMMLCYYFSMTFLQRGMLGVDQFNYSQLLEQLSGSTLYMILASLAVFLQLLGGLAIPVFAYLLVEGFLRTKSYKRYLLRMLLFMLISEVPFDFAMSGKLWNWESQNFLVTLFISLIMLYGLRMYGKSRWGKLLILLAAVLWTGMLRTQFGLCTVLLVAVYYVFREKDGLKTILGCLISLLYVTGPISAFYLKRYQGVQGKQINKFVFYCIYPVLLLILGALTLLI